MSALAAHPSAGDGTRVRESGAFNRFAKHELRLMWRDLSWMFRKRGSGAQSWKAILGVLLMIFVFHVIAYAMLAPFFFESAGKLEQRELAAITMGIMLSGAMILSQTIESVTRAFYARDDMDLILSSPAPSRDLFLVRLGMMALSSWLMAGMLAAPLINVAVMLDGPRWLAGYLVMLVVALVACGLAVLITLGLFRWIGAYRTRVYSQVGAAIIGALFVIGLQIFGILTFGNMSRLEILQPAFLEANAPAGDSSLWFLSRAFSGDIVPLVIIILLGASFFVAAAMAGAVRFRDLVVSAQSATHHARSDQRGKRSFQRASILSTLVHKEIKLIGRDPWLISQSLMQVLYLVPPALMLWMSFEDLGVAIVVAPVIVMAVGQLAGGLAWLTLCGEEAPELVETAPMQRRTRLAAKALAVAAIVAGVVTPLVIALSLVSVYGGLVTLIGALTATVLVVLVQFWFGAQADRKVFRKRQVSTKAATFIEAGVSLSCAGLTGCVVSGSWLWFVPAITLILSLGIGWLIRPRAGGL